MEFISAFDDHNIAEKINRNRQKYFKRLLGISYLDHAGAAQYSDLHIERYHQDLTSSLYGNPHSGSDCSIRATDVVNSVRSRVLQHFNVTSREYSVIFTKNCTAALQLLSESFQLHHNSGDVTQHSSGTSTSSHGQAQCLGHIDKSIEADDRVSEESAADCRLPQSIFAYLDDNHTSVIGMRGVLSERGARLCCLQPSQIETTFSQKDCGREKDCAVGKEPQCQDSMQNSSGGLDKLRSNRYSSNSLFAFPAQSNFNGCRYPLAWTNQIGGHRNCTEKACDKWFVLLDAAAMLTTSSVDLSLWKSDFVTLSFYKMFGFPTGVGALIVKNSSSYVLKKRYFGGGTIEMLLAGEDVHVNVRNLSRRFEDGTLPFLEILALKHGFDTLETVAGTTWEISLHSFGLARFVYLELDQWQHLNGQPVAVFYHDDKTFSSIEKQGPIINFNLLRPDGSYVGFVQVERLASLYGIHLRTGCFCNLGACQRHLQLTSQQILHNHASGHVCGDSMDLIDGQPTGSVRISFGFSSTLEDAQLFLRFVKECFVETSTEVGHKPDHQDDSFGTSATLRQIRIYPVKSCAALKVRSCRLGSRGLEHDRSFMVVTETGMCFSQKRATSLCLLKPVINQNLLSLSFGDKSTCSHTVDLQETQSNSRLSTMCSAKVCGDRIRSVDCGNEVACWLQRVLNVPGLRLHRQLPDDERTVGGKVENADVGSSTGLLQLSLANEAQYLLIATASIRALLTSISRSKDSTSSSSRDEHQTITMEDLIDRFRPNLVVETSTPFEEETWSEVLIGSNVFQVQGRCNRCQMICIDQRTASRTVEPLRSLTAWPNRKCTFGILLQRVIIRSDESEASYLQVGDLVKPLSFVNSVAS